MSKARTKSPPLRPTGAAPALLDTAQPAPVIEYFNLALDLYALWQHAGPHHIPDKKARVRGWTKQIAALRREIESIAEQAAGTSPLCAEHVESARKAALALLDLCDPKQPFSEGTFRGNKHIIAIELAQAMCEAVSRRREPDEPPISPPGAAVPPVSPAEPTDELVNFRGGPPSLVDLRGFVCRTLQAIGSVDPPGETERFVAVVKCFTVASALGLASSGDASNDIPTVETAVHDLRDLLGRIDERIASKRAGEQSCNLTDGGSFTHSENFESVSFEGTVYQFTTSQRDVISMLYAAHKRGTPGLATETLLRDNKMGARLRDLFRQNGKLHPAWGALIIPVDGLKGMYQLAIREKLCQSTELPRQSPA